MAAPLYSMWSENLARTATLSVRSGAVDALYPLANGVDGNPASLVKFTGKQGGVYFDHATAVVVAVAAVIHHDVTPAHAQFRFERNATTPFGGSPTVKLNYTAGADEGDGYKPNVYKDINVAHGSLPSLRHSSIVVDTTDNGSNLQFGEFFLGSTLHQFTHGFMIGYEEGAQVDNVELLTYAKVSYRYKKGFRREGLLGTMRGSRAELDEAIALFRGLTGNAEPLLLIPDPAIPVVHLGLFDDLSIRRKTIEGDVWELSIPFRELSRGLVLPAP